MVNTTPKIVLTDLPVYANYSFSKTIIRINLDLCYQLSLDNNVDFEEQIARIINHEYWHHILFIEQGQETSCAFDDWVFNGTKEIMDYWVC